MLALVYGTGILVGMKEISCQTCDGVCCVGPRAITLSPQERDQMLAARTELVTVVEPADYDRPDAPYPAPGMAFDPEKPEELAETEPLEAGKGRYILVGRCGNLQRFLGREVCLIYDQRPEVCRDFEEAGNTCIRMRLEAEVDTPEIAIEALFARIHETTQ
jgi:Fe-S-cluster containining protein